jgi:hypothetical protein
VRGDVTYIGKRWDSILNLAYVPSQVRANLRGGLRADKWDVAAFVNNLFDDDTLEASRYQSDSATDPFFFQLVVRSSAPRTSGSRRDGMGLDRRDLLLCAALGALPARAVYAAASVERWRNPYTGETLDVPFAPVGPATVHYRPDNTRDLPTELGGTRLEATATIHPPVIIGDDVLQRDESRARVFTPGRAQPFEVHDHATYHGSLANLGDPDVTIGEATVSFADVTGWQRWMNMGERPGGITGRLFGRKLRRYEDLPAAWRARLAQVAPQIAADPVAALDAPAAKFER